MEGIERLFVPTAVAVCLMMLGLVGCEDEEYKPPLGEGPAVLVDQYHSRMQNHSDYKLEKGNYSYQGIFGYRRAIDHLDDNGFQIRTLRTMELSEERLEGFDVLFINLVDQSRPDFTEEEHELIDDWVEEGGGLFVIADHTNVYRSAERINPFLEPMDLEVGFHTLVDQGPEYSVAGNAWPLIFDFEPHPVTRGVEMISMQTGAPILTDHGIAHSSDESFADYWDEDDKGGFYGNWKHDGDEDLEPRGPLAAVAAREYGEGRVVVTGDQNMFGDAWLHFGHNFELFMNAMQWLAGEEDAAPVREARPEGLNIGLDMAPNEFRVGRKGDWGYYVFFVNLNRDRDVTASAKMGVDNADDVLFLMEPTVELDQESIERIEAFFEQGKTVMLSFEADRIAPETVSMLQEIAPDFSLEADGTTYEVSEDAEEFEDLDIDPVEGPLGLASSQLDVDDLEVASLNGGQGLSKYLLEVSSEWGEPFVTAESGDGSVDVARRASVDDGELIVFVQDGFWRNRTLGDSETDEPTSENADAIELQYRLLDYLKEASR
ncbi:MAG: hypothetical protein ACOCV2_13515 [Persicimonas sp.]